MARSTAKRALVWFVFVIGGGTAPAAAPPPPIPSAADLARLIRQLGEDEFEVRETASSRLLLVGRTALPALRRSLAHHDPEVRQRCEDVIARIDADRIALRAKGAVFRTLGDDPDAEVIGVQLNGKQFNDDDLDRLASMRGLTDLDLRGTAVTDAGLAKLARFGHLAQLNLQETRITGRGFVHLESLPVLNFLFLDWAPIEDKSLAHLAKMPGFQLLSLTNTPLTDQGLAQLRRCSVGNLCIRDTRVTDDGLRHLRKMKDLKFLDLQRTAITMRGLKLLAGHEDLRQMWMPPRVDEKEWNAFLRELPKYGNWDW